MNKKAQATRNRIIDAAIHCYAELGVQGSSMDIIAEQAGATKPTLYAHFGSKDNLFEAVLAKMTEELIEEDNFSYDPTIEPVTQLIAIFNRHMERSLNQDILKFYRALLIETIRRDEDVPGYDNSRKEMLLRKWFSDAREDGVIDVDDIETTTNNLLAIISGRFYFPLIMGIKHFTKEELEKEMAKSIETFLWALLN
ncbi:TetR/AcrR family transcriptional regulator [Pseudemcibacter aquimaris]|uniref:TetR/AcrR family transcriptional regulator n=1 Tax=Pseudemcibacter aquimaris TaxID=2857064 RepID=UPI0020123372|nr:TetR/AcrR family transcriptional regulator [Pseudemcibacter aquimaris]MCC3862119.1 TetR/AcrR family transcriptional regulator [Pseudemcibacter aquimaris]WDU58872.1 TetR/AcrR family transcriptional regulator [Pseudemcibacter aquimaris]